MREPSDGEQFEFDRALWLEPTEERSVVWGLLDDIWRIRNGINGGLLLALGANGLRCVLNADGHHPDPLALSAYFLAASTAGPVTVRTEVLRTGRTMSTGQFALGQLDETGRPVERMRGLATFGDLTRHVAPLLRSEAPPRMPSPQDCLRANDEAPPQFTSALLDRMDLRLDPACAGWWHGRPSQRGVIRGWLRLADGRQPDALSLLWALDALYPVAYDLGLIGWTPTVELTGHVRAHPAPGWLQVVMTTANVAGGLMEEDARIWDARGRLVALSRQLCSWRVPSP